MSSDRERDFDNIIKNFRNLYRATKFELVDYLKNRVILFCEKTLLPILIESAKREIKYEEHLKQWRMDNLKRIFPHKSKKFLEKLHKEKGFDDHEVFLKWWSKQEEK